MTGDVSTFNNICETYRLAPVQGSPFLATRAMPQDPLESVVITRFATNRTKPQYPERDVDVFSLPQVDFGLTVRAAKKLTTIFGQVRVQLLGEMLNHLDSTKSLAKVITVVQRLNGSIADMLEAVLRDNQLTLGMEYSPGALRHETTGEEAVLASDGFLLRWSTSCESDSRQTRQKRPRTHLLFLGPAPPSTAPTVPCGNQYASFLPSNSAVDGEDYPNHFASVFGGRGAQRESLDSHLQHLSAMEKDIIVAAMLPPTNESLRSKEPTIKFRDYDPSQSSKSASYSSIAASSSATPQPSTREQTGNPLLEAKENIQSQYPPLTPTAPAWSSNILKGVWSKSKSGSLASSVTSKTPPSVPQKPKAGTEHTSTGSQAPETWRRAHNALLDGKRKQGVSSTPSAPPSVPPPSNRPLPAPSPNIAGHTLAALTSSALAGKGSSGLSTASRQSTTQPSRAGSAAPQEEQTVFLDTNVWVTMAASLGAHFTTAVVALLEATQQNRQHLLFTRQIFRELKAVRSDAYTALLRVLDPTTKRGPWTHVLVLNQLPVRSGVRYQASTFILDPELLTKDTLILAELSAAAQGQRGRDPSTQLHYQIWTGDKALLLRARALNFPADVSRSFRYLFRAQTIPKTAQGWRALLQKSASASNLPRTRQRRV